MVIEIFVIIFIGFLVSNYVFETVREGLENRQPSTSDLIYKNRQTLSQLKSDYTAILQKYKKLEGEVQSSKSSLGRIAAIDSHPSVPPVGQLRPLPCTIDQCQEKNRKEGFVGSQLASMQQQSTKNQGDMSDIVGMAQQIEQYGDRIDKMLTKNKF